MDRLSPQSAFAPEMRLLCACCRVKPRASDLQLQASLATQINADKLLALAIRHRVEPLLFHNLKLHAQGAFPAYLLETLAVRFRRNALKSLQAARTNVQLAQLLKAHGIPYLPLKGITIAQRYYGDMSLRHANDIDFWIPEGSAEMVRSLLLELGCRFDHELDYRQIAERGENHDRFLRRRFHHDVLTHTDGSHLEMHWRLSVNVESFRLDPPDLLRSGDPIGIGNVLMTMMGPVPLLLYLCEHGAQHGWFRFKWLMDLPQVLESHEWNWHQVLLEAKRASCLSALLLGLKLAQTLFGWSAPDPVRQAMRKRQFLNWQVKTVYRNLSLSEPAITDPTFLQSVRHLVYRAGHIESPAFVWNELSFYFLSPRDLSIVRLPDRWFFAYYALRPVLFVWRQIFKRGGALHAK